MNNTFLDNLLKIVKIFQGIAITVFFLSLTSVALRIQHTIRVVEPEVLKTTAEINKTLVELQQIPVIVNDTRRDLFKQTKSLEKNLFQRVDNIETKLFTQTAVLIEKTDSLNQSVERVSIGLESNSKELNMTLNSLNTSIKTVNEYMDCETNSFCWPNITQDTLLSIRNVSQDANKTYLLLNESIPKYNEMFLNITNNTNEITKNVAKLTKPKWYDRILSTTIAGAAIFVSATKR